MSTPGNFNSIIDKVKTRVPMFILIIYSYAANVVTGESQVVVLGDGMLFCIFYISSGTVLTICNIWYSVRAYDAKYPPNVLNKLLYILLTSLISIPLYIVITNLTGFNLPLCIIFGLSHSQSILIMSILMGWIYFLTLLESHYYKDAENQYERIINLQVNDGIV